MATLRGSLSMVTLRGSVSMATHPQGFSKYGHPQGSSNYGPQSFLLDPSVISKYTETQRQWAFFGPYISIFKLSLALFSLPEKDN